MIRNWLRGSLVVLAPLALAGAAEAQPRTCGVPPNGQPWGCELPLDFPPAIKPTGAEVSTTLVIRQRPAYVPVWAAQRCKGTLDVCLQDADCGGASGSCATGYCSIGGKGCAAAADCGTGACLQGSTWGWQQQNLRTYGFPADPRRPVNPADPNDSNLRWGHPGPSIHARTEILKDPAKEPGPSNPAVSPGTRVKVNLFNYLDKQSYHEAMECIPATYQACQNRVCSNDAQKVCTKDGDCAGGVCNLATNCPGGTGCSAVEGQCVTKQVEQKDPNCFHGANVTNFHLHGSHVSPQRPQDFVLLNLYPFGSTGVPSGTNYAVGQYQVDVNPLPWNQAPGTHWYHPHKHGSTSEQVQHGMAGALIFEGPFDDWLNGFYQGKLVDRLLVVQQVSERDNFFTPGFPNYPPKTLVNGFATPVITMRPGEVQRWRFIGATTQASAALEIGFDPRLRDVHQIAQDGVQFAWENYDRQPLRDSEGTYSNFKLSPGNRADFLVKAPAQPGTFTVNSRVFLPNLADVIRQRVLLEQPVLSRVPPMAVAATTPPVDQNGNPLLFTIVVEGPAQSMGLPVTQGTDPACRTTPKPARCWPDTPVYLQDLKPPGGDPSVKLAFRMDGNPGGQPNSVWINNSQYRGDCAGVTTTLGTTQDWLVSNVQGSHNTPPLLAHPFHIHTNPFQVIRNADRTFDPPYVWQDTIALPVPQTTDQEAGPIWSNDDAKVKCPRACQQDNATWNGQWKTTVEGKQSVCGCEVKSDSVLFRHRYDDYTGAYVFHCHFLGHEDRGMMWNVQTVCNPSSLLFGAPQASGHADNCAQTLQALPKCP